MNAKIELPPDISPAFDVLSGEAMFSLSEIPNKPYRQRMYTRFPDIRRTGVYLIRDVQAGPELFYVGIVVGDPVDPETRTPIGTGSLVG